MERPEEPIGQVLTAGALSDFEERLRRAMLVHDRVSDVEDFVADIDPATGDVTFSFSVVEAGNPGDPLPVGPVRLTTED